MHNSSLTYKLPSAGAIIGNYRLIREIGRGGTALIFEAQRTDNGSRHALKILSKTENNAEFQLRFHQEFKALSRLNHPNVLQVFESGEYNGLPYFTMELLEGITLKEAIAEWHKRPPTKRFDTAKSILIQATKALDYVHQLGWVHRDVTPSNIMLLNNGQVKLMDFGVVKIPGTELTIVGEVIGTVAYMSPEQIKNDEVDARADLYSLGATLYLMLTGRRPFHSRTLAGFLKKHLQDTPRPPSEFSPMVPDNLETACLRLLEKEAKNRFASANHLLQYLNSDKKQTNPHRLVGRIREIYKIREHMAQLALGTGGMLFLEGSSGIGRTKLMQATSDLLNAFGFFWSFCKNQNKQQPMYSGFQPLFEELKTNQHPSFQVRFHNDHNDKWTLFSSIRKAIVQHTPVAILMDNLHQADTGTLDLLKFLAFSLLEDNYPILFIMSINTDESPCLADDLLDKAPDIPVHRLQLNPITVSAVEEWLLCLTQNDSKTHMLASRIHREGEGCPFLIEEMIRFLKSKQYISSTVRTHLNMTSEQIQSVSLPLPDSLRENVVRRIQNLPSKHRALVQIVATSRQEVSEDVIIYALESLTRPISFSTEEFNQCLKSLVLSDVLQVRQIENQRYVELSHLWLRDILLGNIDQKIRQDYHRSLGKAQEHLYRQNTNNILENLAYHFERGQMHGKAYAYLRLAAAKLKHRSMFQDALQYLDRASLIERYAREHMTLNEAETTAAEVFLDRSTVYHRLGNWEMAKEHANAADLRASEQQNQELLARIATEKACQARERYELAEADLQIRRALTLAEKAGQARLSILPLYEQGALYWERGNSQDAEQSFRAALEISEHLNDSFGMSKVSNGLGVLSMCVGNSPAARKNFEKSIKFGKELRRVEELALARTNLAELHHCMGNFRKGFELVNATIKESREIRHLHGLGLALRYRSILLTDVGRYAESEENAQMALKIHQDLGNEQEQLGAIVTWLRSLVSKGDWDEAAQLLERSLTVVEKYDSEGYKPILLAWKARVLLFEDQEEARRHLLLAASTIKRDWKYQKVRCYLNIARGWKGVNDTQRAILFAEKALSISDGSGYRYYSMRARQILSTLVMDDVVRARHQRVSEALGRSLSASLPSNDAVSFLSRNKISK